MFLESSCSWLFSYVKKKTRTFSGVASQQTVSLWKRYVFYSYFLRVLWVHFQIFLVYLYFRAHLLNGSFQSVTIAQAKNLLWKFVLRTARYLCLFGFLWDTHSTPRFILINVLNFPNFSIYLDCWLCNRFFRTFYIFLHYFICLDCLETKIMTRARDINFIPNINQGI